MFRRFLRFGALVVAAAAGSAGRAAGQEAATTPAVRDVADGVDYRVYDRTGRPSSLDAIVEASLGEEVLLVGEEHDDMVGHAVEAKLLAAVIDALGSGAGAGRPVVLSLEMFERDVQYVLDEYLGGLISEDHFLRSARPWPEYEARFRPLVELARERYLPVVAANAPRRYVNRVTNEGPEALSALSALARSYLPPLPFPGPSDAYRAQWDALMAEAAGDPDDTMPDSSAAPRYASNPNTIYAQALWDAAMGHAIAGALMRHLGGFVVHYAGSFHVERGTGIVERIEDYRPGTRVVTVVMTKVDDIDAWSEAEHAPLADYVVLTRRPSEAGSER